MTTGLEGMAPLSNPTLPSFDPEAVLRRFEDAWCSGDAPLIEAYLPPDVGSDPGERVRLAVGLVQIDLEYRWTPTGKAAGRADRRFVDDYLDLFPHPPGSQKWLTELVAAEYRVRRWAGDRPTREEYARRFGVPAGELAALLDAVDGELAETIPPPPPVIPGGGGTLTEFRASLLRLGLIGADEIETIDCHATYDPSPARGAALRLVELGRLTRFQADALLRRRGGDLVVGPYLIETQLGGGASGRVFRARHRPTGQVVALKVMRDDAHERLDAAGVARFRQEVEVAGHLDHPHVVRSLGSGVADGVHFLAMELLDGSDFGRLVTDTGPQSVVRASEYVRQAALALQHLADRGMVHRDVKPSNLFAVAGPALPGPEGWGVVKLLDVGFARLPLADTAPAANPLTRTGDFLGTPDYMAPEQAADPHAADVRADLYGLGCTWFFLLAGRPPFAGGTFVQKLDRHRAEPPPDVRRLRPDVPPEVAALLGRLMAKRPEDRPASPAEVAAELAGLLERGLAGGSDAPVLVAAGDDSPISSALRLQRVPPQGRRLRRSAALLTLAVLVVVPAAVMLPWGHDPAGQRPAEGGEEVVEDLIRDLEARERDPAADRDQLRADIRAFRRAHVGTAASERAAGLLFRFPSPLDQLPAGPLPPPAALAAGRDDLPEPPAGLVAVLGTIGHKHWGAVTTLTLDPTGRVLASGGADGAVMLWDAATGAFRRALLGHTHAVYSVAVRPAGRVVCSGSADGSVRLWDADSGRLIRTLTPAGPRRVSAVAFSPDGRTVAAAGNFPRSAVMLWDADTGRPVRELLGHTAAVEVLRFHPHGRVLASAGADGTVRIWDADTGEPTAVLASGAETIRDIAFRPDGAALAVGCEGAVQLWDVAEKRRLWALPQPGLVRTVAFHPDGRTLAFACGGNAAVSLCAAETGRDVRALTGHGDVITGMAFTPDGRSVISSSRDGTVKWWDLRADRERGDVPRQHADVDMVGFRDDGEVVVTAGKDGEVKFWETCRAAELRSLLTLPAVARSVAMSWDGQRLACGGWDGRIKVWEVATGRRVLDVAAHDSWVVRLAFSPDGRMLLSAGFGEAPVLKLWDAVTGQPLRAIPIRTRQPRAFVRDVMFAGSGEAIAALTSEGAVRLWATATGQETQTLPTGPGTDYCAFALRPSGRVGVFGASDGTVSVWDTTTGAKLRSFHAHQGMVSAVTFRADGRVFATAGADGLVRLWDGETAEARYEVRVGPPLNRVHQLAFGPGGRHIATANSNGSVYVIRIPVGQ